MHLTRIVAIIPSEAPFAHDVPVHLHTGKRRTLNLTYLPTLLDRVPRSDHKDTDFPRDLTMVSIVGLPLVHVHMARHQLAMIFLREYYSIAVLSLVVAVLLPERP